MAWRDYLDAVAYADSGEAAVVTVEAIRGAEPRVRALFIELTAPGITDSEKSTLSAELYRICGEVWTLVGQERAQRELIDGPG